MAGSTSNGSSSNLDDALSIVESLTDICLSDQQPRIEAAGMAILSRTSTDANFEDSAAHISCCAKFKEEVLDQSHLVKLLATGLELSTAIYTWRSVSRAIPNIKSGEQPDKLAIYDKTVKVLESEIENLKKLKQFAQDATTALCEEVKKLSNPHRKNEFISENYILSVAKLLNTFAVLDALKNMKCSLVNDLSIYKKAVSITQNVEKQDQKRIFDMQQLQIFTATNDTMTTKLKEELFKIKGADEILAEIISCCVHMFENKIYLLPSEKHLLLKVIGYSLHLIDRKQDKDSKSKGKWDIHKMDKKINIAKIDKLFKNLPVVPLYGDMQIQLSFYITKLGNYHENTGKWSCTQPNGSNVYNLLENLVTIREDHTKYISVISKFNNKTFSSDTGLEKSDKLNQTLYNLALHGLKLLSGWTTQVMELFSWKLLNPAKPKTGDQKRGTDIPKDSVEYERAVRYNYNSDEKFALVEVIGMIKGLQALMLSMESTFTDAIRRHVYTEMQKLVQLTIREPLKVATKKKKEILKSFLISLRATAGEQLDELHNAEPSPANEKDRKTLSKDQKVGSNAQFRKRSVGPSTTQLYMVRVMLESLISDRVDGRKTMRKDIETQSLAELDSFYKSSYYFSVMLNFNQKIMECCDLSQLWFREFYLEIHDNLQNKCIQFPIEMSMPWILTEHIIESKEPSMTEYMLYPLDLYNDSADYILTKFHKQFLYNELEAEVNLCFDQLVFKLTYQIFSHYKKLASNNYLDQQFRSQCAARNIHINYPRPNRYATLMTQRHVMLLGRSINLNRLITQRVEGYFRSSVSAIIQRFENGKISGIVELEAMLDVNKLTHQYLSRYLTLTKFDDIFKEFNNNVDQSYGYLACHVYSELITNVMPNYSYNSSTQRLIEGYSFSSMTLEKRKGDRPCSEPPHLLFGSKVLNQAYKSIYKQYDEFIGAPHFQAIVRLIGYKGIALVISQIIEAIKRLIELSISRYCEEFLSNMPKSVKLQLYTYGVVGLKAYYDTQLQDILNYSDLKTYVYQAFRELGNAIAILLLLEKSVSQEEMADLLQSLTFQYLDTTSKSETRQQEAEQTDAGQHVRQEMLQVIRTLGSPEQVEMIKEGTLLTRERICGGLSIFKTILAKIKECVSDRAFVGDRPINGVMNVDECTEFHRMWSVIQFSLCSETTNDPRRMEIMCGESVIWGGCTLISLLDQQNRFETLDFCYHILRVSKVNVSPEGTAFVKSMCARIEAFLMINRRVFNLMGQYRRRPGNASRFIPLQDVIEFPAPFYS